MDAHTKDLIDPHVQLVTQEGWAKQVVRLSVIRSKDAPGDTKRKPRYGASGLLTPTRWRPGFDEPHEIIADKTGHYLMGTTFEEKLGPNSVKQNQLLLVTWVPWFLVPAHMRHLAVCEELSHEKCNLKARRNQPFWWTVELYGFYAVSWAGLGKYGVLVEVAPRPRTFHPRHKLGLERVWRLAGKQARFDTYLCGKLPAPIHGSDVCVARCARVAGWVLGIPGAYFLAFLGKYVWKRPRRRW